MYDFLLVRHCNYSSILYHLRVIWRWIIPWPWHLDQRLLKVIETGLAANYHPISLLSVCYKLLERLALQRISPTVEGLLSPEWPGWFPERSKHLWPGYCSHHFHQKWIPAEPKDWRRLSGLTAAYDTVWHTGLLYKLSKGMPYWFTRSTFQGAHGQWHQCLEIPT